MARMIDADVAIKRFRGWLEGPHEASEYNAGFDDAICRVLDVIERLPTLTQPNETPPCYQPDGDGCAYQCYDGQDEPIEKCKACPLCCSDKRRHYTPPNKLERAGLYGKYTVLKNEDGSLVTNCFVLRPAEDPAAVAALRAYAATTDNAELADDIINWVGAEPNEWVSVEERLPEKENAQVLMTDGEGWYISSRNNMVRFLDCEGIFIPGKAGAGVKVTHWMPLPQLPKEEKKSD